MLSLFLRIKHWGTTLPAICTRFSISVFGSLPETFMKIENSFSIGSYLPTYWVAPVVRFPLPSLQASQIMDMKVGLFGCAAWGHKTSVIVGTIF